MSNFRMSHFGGAVLLSAILSGSLHAESDERPDWFLTQRNITAILMQPNANLAALVSKVGESSPSDGHWAMFNFCVFARAGMYKESIQTLGDLKRFCPELGNYQLLSIYHHACERQAWDLAQAAVEIFAEVIEVSLEYGLVKHFLDTGWSIEQVDEWLASKPKGINSHWVKMRLRFNMQRGRGAALLNELSDHVRANPNDVKQAVAFLNALIYARKGREDVPDLMWFSETIKPESATGAREIASLLMTLEAWKSATVFCRQGIATELTDKEIQQLGMMSATRMPAATVRASFDAYTRESLAECLLKIEQAEEAQKWMVEASDIRKKYGLGSNALFAGHAQAMSGERTIEERIKAEETTSENEPKYWWERAQYYRGRNESAQEKSALEKGLALTEIQAEFEPEGSEWRKNLLSDYVELLKREGREKDAVVLLRKEIEKLSGSSTRAARLLAFELQKHVSADDAVLWTWLEKRSKWESTEERLLRRMLENASRDELDKHFTHAEDLAFRGDPSRAHVLGGIQNQMKFPQRALPLLEYAIEKTQDDELKNKATSALFGSYLDTGDWKRAEQIFPNVVHRLTLTELSERYSRIAIGAAKAGAKADAMRIWSRVANLDLSATGAVKDLSDAGLTDELIDFYVEVQKTLPSSSIPPEVLKTLRSPPRE